MAKYNVKMSCGHEQCMELFGKVSERERKIKYFEEFGICKDCYNEQKKVDADVKAEKEGLETVEMTYREYKTNYPDCKTVPGSYDGKRKTIMVYVKKGEWK